MKLKNDIVNLIVRVAASFMPSILWCGRSPILKRHVFQEKAILLQPEIE